ncbi:hypothetical protein CNY67_05055 [Desulfovibrio sp. G11]|nr:hypothetical protein CNY67_05055 [Desulfovibrio sp. G11]
MLGARVSHVFPSSCRASLTVPYLPGWLFRLRRFELKSFSRPRCEAESVFPHKNIHMMQRVADSKPRCHAGIPCNTCLYWHLGSVLVF